jgi:hypothetical protein
MCDGEGENDREKKNSTARLLVRSQHKSSKEIGIRVKTFNWSKTYD